MKQQHFLGDIEVLGIPYDTGSSFLQGSAEAPTHILQSYRSDSANTSTEAGFDLQEETRIHFSRNMDMTHGYDGITTEIEQVLAQGKRTLSLGGDHSITFPIIRAYAKHFPDLHILQLDAHGDLYDNFEGNKFSHACPFARIMEAGLVERLLQVGNRCLTPHQLEQAERFEVEIIEMRHVHDDMYPLPIRLEKPLYLSLDLDVLDPAFAPGVSHHEPGGMSTRQVLNLIQSLPVQLVGADIVEYNPRRDINGLTGMVAAKCMKEVLAKML